MTEITKEYKKKRNIFLTISILLYLGTCGFLIIYGVVNGFNMTSDKETYSLGQQLLSIFMPLLVSFGILIVITIFVKEKVKNTVWMANMLLSIYLFGINGGWVVVSIYAVDEFIIEKLYQHYKAKFTISKEIDRRL